MTLIGRIRRKIRRTLQPYDFRYTRIIERMHLAACVPCQYDCVDCSHAEVRYQFKGYQLNIPDLKEFIRVTEESRYLVQLLDLTGPGDPLLWKNLKEGLRLLHASRSFQTIRVVTNGLALNRLDEEDWRHIDRLDFSMYPANAQAEADLAALGPHRAKVTIRDKGNFKTAPQPGETAPVPCNCECTGPMYFNRQVYYYCGPTVFGAAASKGVAMSDHPEMFGALERDYMKPSRPPAEGLLRTLPGVRRVFPIFEPAIRAADHDLCRYCFANGNREFARNSHIAYKKSLQRPDPGSLDDRP